MLHGLKAALLAVGLFAGVTAQAETEDAIWRTVYEQRATVPYGTSYSRDVRLDLAGPVSELKVEMLHDDGYCDAVTAYVDVTHNAAQRSFTRYYPNAAGVFELPGDGIYLIKFYSQQNRWREGYCRRVVSVREGRTPSGEFRLLGVIRYEGGFVSRANLDLAPALRVSQFHVRIPSFCAGTEILEAGTVTEGVYDIADLVDTNDTLFDVNGGAGSRIAAVQISLNGPRDTSCDIPVYALIQ